MHNSEEKAFQDSLSRERKGNKKEGKQHNSRQEERPESVNMAVNSYIGFLVFIPLFFAKDDEFVQYHVKQGLALFLVEVSTLFIAAIPVVGFILAGPLIVVCGIFFVMGGLNVIKREKRELPVIGKYAKLFKI